MSVEDLESAISRLSAEELARFAAWFEDFLAIGGIVRSRVCKTRKEAV
jgi:hypothetical protein